ncbi:MAG: hypothetical protein M1385_02730 [Candidatus Marsarchaeota archaeon]|nr:hypothetical protein [Candidatus Marsarchaeota archaeon]
MALNGKTFGIIGIAIIVIAVAVVILFMGGGASIKSTSSTAGNQTKNSGTNAAGSGNTGSSIPKSESSIYTSLASKKNISFGSLLNYITDNNSANSTPIMVSYNGSVVGTYSIISLNFPVKLDYAKVNNDWRLNFSAVSLPIVGNYTGYIIYKNNTLYSCSKSTVINDTVKNTVVNCQTEKNSNISGINTSGLSNYNLSINKLNETSYDGTPCLYVSASANNLTAPATQNSTIPSEGKLNIGVNTCIYAQYRLPLNLNINITAINKTNNNQILSINVKLNKVSITNNVNQTFVDTLPGPIVNYTGINTANNSYGGGGYGSNNMYYINNACNQTVFIYLNKGYAVCNNFRVVLVGLSSQNATTQYSEFNIYNNKTGMLVMAGLGANLFHTSDVTYENVTLDITNEGTFNMTGLQDSAIRLNTMPS